MGASRSATTKTPGQHATDAKRRSARPAPTHLFDAAVLLDQRQRARGADAVDLRLGGPRGGSERGRVGGQAGWRHVCKQRKPSRPLQTACVTSWCPPPLVHAERSSSAAPAAPAPLARSRSRTENTAAQPSPLQLSYIQFGAPLARSRSRTGCRGPQTGRGSAAAPSAPVVADYGGRGGQRAGAGERMPRQCGGLPGTRVRAPD